MRKTKTLNCISYWNASQDALNQNRILQFDYTDCWGKQTEQRRLRPYQLVLDDGVRYLFGFDELRQAERIFSSIRMRNAVVSDFVSFIMPPDFSGAFLRSLRSLRVGCSALRSRSFFHSLRSFQNCFAGAPYPCVFSIYKRFLIITNTLFL
ncbi:MAG: WYL domain-containing protein [Treponema sp.]|nr:WYL domain-containing protein [Treponema sp.]